MTSAVEFTKHDLDGGFASSVVVAIVNYCTPDLVVDCLESLASVRDECQWMKVVVADNASPDGSGQAIGEAIAARGWSDWAELMQMPRNGGFSYGNNGVIRAYLHADEAPDFFWLLNSDTVARDGSLTALLDFMRSNPSVGIAGSRLEHPDATPQESAFRFHTIAAEFETSANIGLVSRWLWNYRVSPDISDTIGQYDWLSGASMLIRREVLVDTGLFDEGYFLYFEETDFCLRASQKGWSCWYVPDSHVVHLVGKSTGVWDKHKKPRRRPRFWFESRQRYYVKHHGRFYGTLADAALITGTVLWMIRAAIERRPSLCPEKFLTDVLRHSALLTSTRDVQHQE